MSKIIDMGDLLEKSWKLFKANLVFCLGIGAIFFVMALFLDRTSQTVAKLSGLVGDSLINFLDPFYAIVSLAGAIVMLLFQLGVIKTSLNLVDGKETNYNDLWNTGGFLFAYVGAALLMAVPVLLGFLALILPGLYLYVRWQFFSVIIIDKKVGPIEALKESWRLTANHVFDSFLLLLVTGLLTVAGALFFGIGLIVTLPFTMICLSMFYRELEEKVG